MIETYRLTEWAAFMELSGQLVDGAEHVDDSHSSTPPRVNYVLPEDVMEHLIVFCVGESKERCRAV